mgnify:FL=1
MALTGSHNPNWKGGISVGNNRKKYDVVYQHNRKVKIRNLGGSFTTKDWTILKKRYDDSCLFCGETEENLLKYTGIGLTIDHKIPIVRWEEWKKNNSHILYGCNDIKNIQPLCFGCNSRKSAKIYN